MTAKTKISDFNNDLTILLLHKSVRRNFLSPYTLVNKCKEHNCNIKYIGERGRTVGLSIMEHEKALEKKEATFSNTIVKRDVHRFNFSQCKILTTENRVCLRKFIRAAHTKFSISSINRSGDIPNCYRAFRLVFRSSFVFAISNCYWPKQIT